MTDKHKRIREAHQAANGAGKYSYVMIISSDLGALLAERDALREVLTDLTSANGHVEYGRALARSRALLAQRES